MTVRSVETMPANPGIAVYPLTRGEGLELLTFIARMLHARDRLSLTPTAREHAVLAAVVRLVGSAASSGNPGSPDNWMSTTEAAERLGLTDRGIRKAIARGALAARRGSGGSEVNEQELYWWASSRQAKEST